MRWRRTPTSKAGSIRVSRPKFLLNLIFIAHFPPFPKKGLGWFFPQGGGLRRGGNGEWDIAVLVEVTPLISRQTPQFCWLTSSTSICGVKPATVRVSVYEQWAALLSARPFSSQRGLTRMDDRPMSGCLTEEGDRALTLICRGTNQPRRMGSNPAHIG